MAADEVEDVYCFPLIDVMSIEQNERLSQMSKRYPSYSYQKDNVFIWV